MTRLARLLRGIDADASRRILSIKESEARDVARLLISLAEVYEAHYGESLLCGAVPLPEDPQNAPERLRASIHALKTEFDALRLLISALRILDEQEQVRLVGEQLTQLTARLDAHLQAMQSSEGDSRAKEVA